MATAMSTAGALAAGKYSPAATIFTAGAPLHMNRP